MVVFSYNSVPFVDLPEAFAGWMLRTDDPGAGPVFEPRTVEQRFDLAGPSRATVPMVVDLAHRTVRWLDVSPRVTGDHHAVHRHQGELARLAGALSADFDRGARISVGELARIHASARADEILVRGGGRVVRFGRRTGEGIVAFAARVADGADADGPATGAEVADLQFVMRGDGGAEVCALHPGALDAATVRVRGAADFVADLG